MVVRAAGATAAHAAAVCHFRLPGVVRGAVAVDRQVELSIELVAPHDPDLGALEGDNRRNVIVVDASRRRWKDERTTPGSIVADAMVHVHSACVVRVHQRVGDPE